MATNTEGEVGPEPRGEGRLRRLRRTFREDDLYGDDDVPFADQRRRVDAPVRRLFATDGRTYWRSFGLGLGAGTVARLDDLPADFIERAAARAAKLKP